MPGVVRPLLLQMLRLVLLLWHTTWTLTFGSLHSDCTA
jgi:hypothetical protein